ncbi:PIN domain-containing protein [Hymenobacter cyanobacteriorum]|uniref:PIN domain-containing protein n=1 Tax=Hymenobacter cyanobacteriorum TaxID=2926463 RepID=UPI002410E255|nr:PIN domain-containing protein [Hymenobacter cyanobacteriorum]
MWRAVIDTNCLLASLNRKSPFHRLYELFATEAFHWVLSNEILTEYDEILTRHYSASTAAHVLKSCYRLPIHRFRRPVTNGSSSKPTPTTINSWT